MLQDLASTTFGLNHGSYTASIRPLRLQHKSNTNGEVLVRVKTATDNDTVLAAQRWGEVEPRGKLRKRRESYADNHMELVKTEWSNARVH
jgi:hypothetical protein